MRKVFFLALLLTVVFAKAEPFDSFLVSLQNKYPVDTKFMSWVLKTHKTKLALPSLLEKWGVINQDAAATYNGILNTVVLKPEYTTGEVRGNGKTKQRIKTLAELQQAEPLTWTVRAGTIFHELSHAEFDWLPKSKDQPDVALLQLLNSEFDDYLKKNHRSFSAMDRKIARSELFAYFRDEFLAQLVNKFDEILLENGYYSTDKTCRNTNRIVNHLSVNPGLDPANLIFFGPEVEFRLSSLPIIFVKGKDAEIDKNDPVASKLNKALWNQLTHHYAPAKSKSELIQWMNTQPALLELIKPCRSSIVLK